MRLLLFLKNIIDKKIIQNIVVINNNKEAQGLTQDIKKGDTVWVPFTVTDIQNGNLDLQCPATKKTEVCFWPTNREKKGLRIFNFPAASVIQTTALERSGQ